MCLNNYIGIRGECQTATIYIDDLPGINIVNASQITDSAIPRPIDLVNKAFNLAQKEVLSDLFAMIQSLKYNTIIDDSSYSTAGTYRYIGETTQTAYIHIFQGQNDKFIRLHVFGFEIISDREITKDFVITDGYGNVDIVTVDLEIGLNEIPFDKYTDSEFIKITFDLSDFKVGIQQQYCVDEMYNHRCDPCHRSHCGCECANVVVSHSNLGFNLCVRCEANECKLIKYLAKEIELPLLYKTGVNYFLEAKMSDRINAYTRNKTEDIDEMLTYWMGGFNNETQTGVSSIYKQHLKNSVAKVSTLLENLNSKIFTHAGSFICNTLP
jgi:hypothetical protein